MALKTAIDIENLIIKIGKQKAEEIRAKIEPVFLDLLKQEEMAIVIDGAREGGWLYDIAYEAMLNTLFDNVYEAYEPKVYDRRYTAPGGLASRNSMELTVDIGKEEVVLRNTAEYNSHVQLNIPLADFIDSGSAYPNPRRFYHKIPVRCNTSGMKQELVRRLQERVGEVMTKALQQISM